MKLLTFYDDYDDLKLGVIDSNVVIDVVAASTSLGINLPRTPTEFYQQGEAALVSLHTLLDRSDDIPTEARLDATTIQIGPAVPSPGKIVCVGLNYKRHAEEAGMAVPTEPVLFSKYNNAIAAPKRPITLPPVANDYDYEAEIAFVIGRHAKNVAVADAHNYVLGYCNVNDVSARDLQLRTGQWLIGKTLDDFLPIGPWLVTADDIPDPQDLQIRCWRNGELVQDSNTSDMIFSIAEIVAHISSLMTLEPGDLISTGTPEGVIFGKDERNWLASGDEVIVEVEKLGRLHNTFIREV